MLQQTRVAVVLDYYRRFLCRFPTVEALARAPLGEVIRAWAGLGYYRRARHLHRAAREIVREHGGQFPDELRAATHLPGVGRYTARAVLSIAYGAPLAVVDGNVARVLARLAAMRGELRSGTRAKWLDQHAQELLAANAPGDWNQAMMELGATVCTPRAPRCPACPVAGWCRARALGIAESLPAPRAKRRPVRLRIAAAILLDRKGRTLLMRSRDGISALFSGMWHFPAVQLRRSLRRAPRELARTLAELGIAPAQLEPLGSVRHTVTCRELTLQPYLVRVQALEAGARPPGRATRIVPLVRLATLAVSNATRKIAAAVFT
jgi:A/G-specific adenine glycosylase